MTVVVNKDTLTASICRDSFFDFVKEFWDTFINEKPVWNWHIEYLCEELQKTAERVFRREPKEYDLIINISPGSTKSTICSVMFPVWCWIRDASIKSICGSYSSPLSLNLAVYSRTILQSDKFQRVFPEIILKEAGMEKMSNYQGGQRIATSTGGSITGMHGHFIIIDDPINPKEAQSNVTLNAANVWMAQTLLSRKTNKDVTVFILIMQRLHQDDPTGHMIANWKKDRERLNLKPIKHICLPAFISEGVKVKPRRLRKFYKEDPADTSEFKLKYMDPIRLSKAVLAELKSGMGEYGFSGQMLQNPIPLGGAMFKTEQIQIQIPPIKLKEKVRYWDKAGTLNAGAYTVGALLGRDYHDRFWILDIVRHQLGAFARQELTKRTAQMDGYDVKIGIEQEPGSGGKESAEISIRDLAGFVVQVDRPVGSKELRAEPFAVQVNGGNVLMAPGEWNREYLDEMSFFPNSTFKDQVDASSAAFAMLAINKKKIGALW